MRTLFFKIFLWFWLAMVAVGVTVAIVVGITQNEPVGPGLRNTAAALAAVYARTAAETYARGGEPALRALIAEIERQNHVRAFLFDAQGQELAGGKSSSSYADLLARARNSQQAEFHFLPSLVVTAQRAETPNGQSVILLIEISRLWQGEPGIKPRVRLLRGFVLLVTAGLLCFWLARSLTGPLGQLRAATNQLASGDLSARVTALNRRDELAELGRDFNQMAERLESLVTAQKRLLHDVSHELRSPLARLGVALELARQQAGEKAASALDRIEREAQRLNELIGQLLTLSRLESQTETAERAPVELEKLLAEVADDAQFEARRNQREVIVRECTPCRIQGNERLLRSALENVVRNAIRYTPEHTAVEVSLRCSGNEAEFIIRDHGPGVPDAALDNIFRAFYRVAEARERKTGGFGLGLSIAERAIGWHGGTVSAANLPQREGGGLCVTLRLPGVITD